MPKMWLGKSIRQLNVRGNYGVNIIGIMKGEYIEVNMDLEEPLDEKMILVIVGKNSDFTKIGVDV